ncbi:MAG: anthranilate phosphoribosyltransferase [Methanomassiliicoccales archaeon]
MIRDAIKQVISGQDLTYQQSKSIMHDILFGRVTPGQIGALIMGLEMKGAREEELLGFVSEMMENVIKIASPNGTIDLCGTGGDGLGTFNISTVASIVVASCGIPVAKHSNNSVSGVCGSADVLGAIGIPYDMDPPDVERCLFDAGIGFLYAPKFHPLMKKVSPIRKELGVRSFFNLLGPLASPVNARYRLLGVYDPHIAARMARLLKSLGVEHALVAHGSGLDEITNTGETMIVELNQDRIFEYVIEPEMFGMDRVDPRETAGGDAFDNARILLSALHGHRGPKLDLVLLNAGAAIYAANRAESIEDGVCIAKKAVESGKSLQSLRNLYHLANELEAERQLRISVSTLMERSRIYLRELSSRYREIADLLIERIKTKEKGRELLGNLDGDILNETNALTIIALKKMLKITSEDPAFPAGEHDRLSRSSKKLSESITNAPGLAIIGEFKNRIPSAREMYVPPPPSLIASSYQSLGLQGMSVVVEEHFFAGSLQLFEFFRNKVKLPLIYKDFVVSKEQIGTAANVGADSVLIISKLLNREALEEMIDESINLGIEPLVEVHDRKDVDKVSSCSNFCQLKLIGINSRDLRTLETDLSVLSKIKDLIPHDKILIAESGVTHANDLMMLAGFDAVLVGSFILTSVNPVNEVQKIIAKARRIRR